MEKLIGVAEDLKRFIKKYEAHQRNKKASELGWVDGSAEYQCGTCSRMITEGTNCSSCIGRQYALQ